MPFQLRRQSFQALQNILQRRRCCSNPQAHLSSGQGSTAGLTNSIAARLDNALLQLADPSYLERKQAWIITYFACTLKAD